MAIQLPFFVLGLVALIAGAEPLVRGASMLVLAWGISARVVVLLRPAPRTSK